MNVQTTWTVLLQVSFQHIQKHTIFVLTALRSCKLVQAEVSWIKRQREAKTTFRTNAEMIETSKLYSSASTKPFPRHVLHIWSGVHWQSSQSSSFWVPRHSISQTHSPLMILVPWHAGHAFWVISVIIITFEVKYILYYRKIATFSKRNLTYTTIQQILLLVL